VPELEIDPTQLQPGRIVRYRHHSRARRLANKPMLTRRARVERFVPEINYGRGQVSITVLNADGSENSALGRITIFPDEITAVEAVSPADQGAKPKTSTDWSRYEGCTRRFCDAAAGDACRDLTVSYRPGFDRRPLASRPHAGRKRVPVAKVIRLSPPQVELLTDIATNPQMYLKNWSRWSKTGGVLARLGLANMESGWGHAEITITEAGRAEARRRGILPPVDLAATVNSPNPGGGE
jgi:hypothetical protein